MVVAPEPRVDAFHRDTVSKVCQLGVVGHLVPEGRITGPPIRGHVMQACVWITRDAHVHPRIRGGVDVLKGVDVITQPCLEFPLRGKGATTDKTLNLAYHAIKKRSIAIFEFNKTQRVVNVEPQFIQSPVHKLLSVLSRLCATVQVLSSKKPFTGQGCSVSRVP